MTGPTRIELTLVLGGGGAAAMAWEIGVLRGLAEHGLEVSGASAMIGTSAGAVVACRLTSGASLSELEVWARTPGDRTQVDVDFPALMRRLADIGAGAPDPVEGRRRIGALAMAAPTGSPDGRRSEIAELVGSVDWPGGTDLVVTAVDARSGALVTFTRDSGVALIDAVGASCAVPGVWPPVQIGDRVFVDGGVRSSVNASLATGAGPVLVLAPQAGPGGLDREIGRLSTNVSVDVVAADQESIRAFGPNPLDTHTGEASTEAGLRQGRAAGGIAERLLARPTSGGQR
jgi:NTE family protein